VVEKHQSKAENEQHVHALLSCLIVSFIRYIKNDFGQA
jgi:hypothetical protein